MTGELELDRLYDYLRPLYKKGKDFCIPKSDYEWLRRIAIKYDSRYSEPDAILMFRGEKVLSKDESI